MALAGSAAQGGTDPVPVWHDPWLNWDFINMTGVAVNDLEIVVDNPNFNPSSNDPTQVNMGPWTQFAIRHDKDYDGDGDLDTIMTWSGAVIPPGIIAHGGLYMNGSGLVLDAYWTLNGAKVGASTAITYERTKIIFDPEVHMELMIAPGWYKEHSSGEAGWTHIRTFVNIPADLLNLEDLNRTLDLDSLSAYEVFPRVGGPTGAPIGYGDTIYGVPDSFFDVFLAQIDPKYAGPGYEALLHAEVVTVESPPVPIGEFWNLNPQSPEPATLSLLALGALAIISRRRAR
jgi:hypothetical protein